MPKYIDAYYDRVTGEYHDNSHGIETYHSDECDMYLLGKIDFDADWGKETERKFRNDALSLNQSVSGMFILLIFDRQKKELYAFHDRLTSPYPLYYTVAENKVFLSTSLKKILKRSGIKREENAEAAVEFLTNGYIYGKGTLVKGVDKLAPFRCLKITDTAEEQIPVKYPIGKVEIEKALQEWTPVLHRVIEKEMPPKGERISLMLSNGFDSNYIAYEVEKMTGGETPVHAYSVGGKKGINEVDFVKQNVPYYPGMVLHTALVGSDTLQSFPDIVWRLEGATYERGVFLQYLVSRLASEDGCRELLCGEGMDQVADGAFYREDNETLVDRFDGRTYSTFEDPYIGLSSMILKKNGIIANSFRIENKFPYLDESFVALTFALRGLNGQDKKFHKWMCRERLPIAVAQNLTKSGGATHGIALFETKDELKRFLKFARNCDAVKTHRQTVRMMLDRESPYKNSSLKTNVISLLSANRRRYRSEKYKENVLQIYLKCVSLDLFEKLFLSGDFDEKFDEWGIDVTLRDLYL